MKPKVLAVDDEDAILSLLDASLSDEGYDVLTATTAAEFRRLSAENQIDVFLIDVGLTDGNGFSLVKELRHSSKAGIIMLTGRSSETDQVVGLEIGADDYVTKPFRIRELAARVNAVYRRTAVQSEPGMISIDTAPPQGGPAADYSFDGYRLSTSARRLWGADGVEIVLTTAEFDLLAALLRRRGQVLDRDQLMNAMKGRDWESYDRAIDGLISRLRHKLPASNPLAHFIRTVHGVGYSFTG
jgi:two-component system torCAD operon response regulator TorR